MMPTRVTEIALKAGSVTVATACPSASSSTTSTAATRGRAATESCHVLGRRSLLALHHIEFDTLPFIERLEARGLNCGMVDEEVLAAVFRRNETKSLVVVEPFYGSFLAHRSSCSVRA